MVDKNKVKKAEKAVLKKYPEAKLMCDWGGKFFIATKEGKDICNLQISQTIDKYDFDGEEELYGFNAALKLSTPNSPPSVWSKLYLSIV